MGQRNPFDNFYLQIIVIVELPKFVSGRFYPGPEKSEDGSYDFKSVHWAREECKNMGLELAKISNEEENDAAVHTMNQVWK